MFLILVRFMCPYRCFICVFQKNSISTSLVPTYITTKPAIVLFQTLMAALPSSIRRLPMQQHQSCSASTIREHLSIQTRESKVQQQCRYEQPFIQKTCLQSALSANHTQAVTFSARYGI